VERIACFPVSNAFLLKISKLSKKCAKKLQSCVNVTSSIKTTGNVQYIYTVQFVNFKIMQFDSQMLYYSTDQKKPNRERERKREQNGNMNGYRTDMRTGTERILSSVSC